MLHANQIGRLSAPAVALGGQFARFVAVGVTNTAITFATYALLLGAGLHYLGALAPAFALGALNGYTLNRAWTFRAGAFAPAGLARYVVAQLLGLGTNALLLIALVDGLHAQRLLAQLVAMPVVSLTTFAANRLWVFRA